MHCNIGCFHPRPRSLSANHEVRFIGQLNSGAVVRAVDSFGKSAVRCDSACRAGVDGIATPKSFEDKLEKMLTALCLRPRFGAEFTSSIPAKYEPKYEKKGSTGAEQIEPVSN